MTVPTRNEDSERGAELTSCLPFWLLTLAFLILLPLTNLFMAGLFLDGLIYSGISRNLAHGIGSFWNPRWSATSWPSFHEHPPLALGLEALFFRILGDGRAVERLYGLVIFLITLGLLVWIWREVFPADRRHRAQAWVPLFFWCLFPLNTWSYANNMLDNTMVAFDLAAVVLLVKHLRRPRTIYLASAAAAVLLGFLANGPVALSPLAFLGIAWLALGRELRRDLVDSAAVLGFLAVFGAPLAVWAEARASLTAYVLTQFVPSLTGQRYLEEPRRFYILGKLILNLLPQAVTVLIGRSWTAWKPAEPNPGDGRRRWALLFFLLALATSLPIVLSQKQVERYLLPSFPYFALSFALLFRPAADRLAERVAARPQWLRRLTWCALAVLTGSALYSPLQWHRVKNPNSGPIGLLVNILPAPIQRSLFPVRYQRIIAEADRIQDIETIATVVPAGSILGVDQALWEDWSLHGYFQRWFFISISTGCNQDYWLTRADAQTAPPAGYRPVAVATRSYRLYWRQPGADSARSAD